MTLVKNIVFERGTGVLFDMGAQRLNIFYEYLLLLHVWPLEAVTIPVTKVAKHFSLSRIPPTPHSRFQVGKMRLQRRQTGRVVPALKSVMWLKVYR